MEEEKQGTSIPPTGMLNALLSNPELLQRLASLLGGGLAPSAPTAGEREAAGEDPARSASESASAAASSAGGGFADGLGAILSNPAMLEKLPEIMAMMKPLLNTLPAQNGSPSQSGPEGGSLTVSDRERLLLALKPFLSAQRREAVDSILRISRLGAAVQLLT
ncbi:MAG: hypothetical protein IKJ35_09630 [Clostridia bacterium]|nr:hypothetical protein [Clostridia bacterium]